VPPLPTGQDDLVRIRPATPDDLEDVGRVHALSRNAAYVDLVPAEALARVTPRTQTDVWRRRTTEGTGRAALLVAEIEDSVSGFSFATAPSDALTAELRALHVLPDHHGTGAGQALHDAALDAVRTWGCTDIELWVLRGNDRAQSFYRRNGWVHDGTTAAHEVGGVEVPILRYARPVAG
jgi:GNAT superfamily N-acetyltransferase